MIYYVEIAGLIIWARAYKGGILWEAIQWYKTSLKKKELINKYLKNKKKLLLSLENK